MAEPAKRAGGRSAKPSFRGFGGLVLWGLLVSFVAGVVAASVGAWLAMAGSADDGEIFVSRLPVVSLVALLVLVAMIVGYSAGFAVASLVSAERSQRAVEDPAALPPRERSRARAQRPGSGEPTPGSAAARPVAVRQGVAQPSVPPRSASDSPQAEPREFGSAQGAQSEWSPAASQFGAGESVAEMGGLPSPSTPLPPPDGSDTAAPAETSSPLPIEPSTLIAAWNGCRSKGRFLAGNVRKELSERGLELEVQSGSALGIGDSVLGVYRRGSDEIYLLPDFGQAPAAVAEWFDSQSRSNRLTAIGGLTRVAVVRRSGNKFEIQKRGLLA